VPRGPIRVLVVDDSAASRHQLASLLERSPLIEVVGGARDGVDALDKAITLRPDLITLDLAMPRMDGFTFLRILMVRQPTPVVVVSARAAAEDTFRALEFGAVDFVAKPARWGGPELAELEQELIRKAHAVRSLRLPRPGAAGGLRAGLRPALAGEACEAPRVVAIGASTGGPAALLRLLGAFPEQSPCAFAVSQHMPPGFTRSFAERLDRLTALRVREARGGEDVAPGQVLVAPGDHHLEFEWAAGRPRARVLARAEGDRHAPAVDRMFESAAKSFGPSLMAVVLTGMGDDGRRGVHAVKAAGGAVVAEAEETAVIFGMPGQAIRTGLVDAVLPLPEIAAAIRSGVPRRGGAAAGAQAGIDAEQRSRA
jgi:two-component system chemotaxis response regulator CheB